MKVLKTKNIESATPVIATGMFVDKGYLKGEHGSLPDVDCDFQSDRRQDVKAYIEQRYNHHGKQRVFSAGTVTTLKVKAVLKDVARTKRIPVGIVNYITAIFDDDKCDFTGIFKLAAKNKKVAKFIETYPELFEDIRTLMFQPRSNSIHASALLVTPDDKDGEDAECFDFVPIKKVDGILVSENDGYELDELGLLKNDCLATKELSKIQATMNICNEVYDAGLNLENLSTGSLDDVSTYKLLQQGFTQNVFQFSSRGITKMLIEMKPDNIEDLIAANALYRPATLANGSVENFINCKRGDSAPVYLWGTYESLKNTYAEIVYQEQIVFLARQIGNFSLGDGVKLVKYISKKKTDKIKAMKDKFMEGAKKNGCPENEADIIWGKIESAGMYCFNRSHATAYAVTSYVGAYLKANYPTAFYTVALQWADDKELIPIMSEMEACSKAKVVPPDINVSELGFHTDYQTDSIFWSISRIKQLGAKAVNWIIAERDKNGNFTSIDEFIERVFRHKFKKYKSFEDEDTPEEETRCPVNARCVKNLILAGCFDSIENAGSIIERYAILERAATKLGFEIKEKDFPLEMRGKHYFWSQKQIEVSGIGSIDYRRIYDNSEVRSQIKGRATYLSFPEIAPKTMENKKPAICATVVDFEEKKLTRKQTGEEELFCKMTLQQNNDIITCVVWPTEYKQYRGLLMGAKNKIIIMTTLIRYSDYEGKNNLQLTKNPIIAVL